MDLVNRSWILQSLDSGGRAGTPGKIRKAMDILTGRRPSWAVVTLPRWHQVLGLQCQMLLLLKSPRGKTAVFSMAPLWLILNVWFLATVLLRYHSRSIQFRYHTILEHFHRLREKTCPHFALTSLPAFPCTPKS